MLFESKMLDKYDTMGMYKIYDSWPDIAKQSYDSENESIEYNDIDHIVFAGMGGSGAIGDFFSSILSKTNVHVSVIKGYNLPKTVDKNTLFFPISISGETIETLSVLKSAKNETNCRIVAFTSGGKMKDFCKENKIEFRTIPQVHSPRASFVKYVYTLLKVLEPILPITKIDVVESLNKLADTQKEISSNNLTEKNPAISLANWISSIPIVYYPWGLEAAATRFKNSLQENAKLHAIKEDVLEACHNNIMSWEKPSDIKPILLQGQDDHVKTKERWKILKDYFSENGIDFWEVFSVQGNILSKLVNLVYLLDYTTIYLATKQGIDPSPIKSIDYIKHRL